MNDGSSFSKLMDEFGAIEKEEESQEGEVGLDADENAESKVKATEKKDTTAGPGSQAPLMSQEEREIGSVSWSVYSRYLSYAGGSFWALVILGLLTLQQGSTGAYIYISQSYY